MEVTITYPRIKRKLLTAQRIRVIIFCLFVVLGAAAGIVNLSVGGKAWSLVAIAGLWVVWNLGISRPLVENHWMGRTTHCILAICVLLILIDELLAPGWAGFVVPIVGFGLLIALDALFFANLPRRRQNVLVIFWVSLAGIAAFICAALGWLSLNWPMIVLGSLAPALMIAVIAVLRRQLLEEMKKRFHT